MLDRVEMADVTSKEGTGTTNRTHAKDLLGQTRERMSRSGEAKEDRRGDEDQEDVGELKDEDLRKECRR